MVLKQKSKPTKTINHSPTLESVIMVEKTIQKYSQECGKYQLWKKLPKKMMYQTFQTIIDYLESSSKIIYEVNEVVHKAINETKEVSAETKRVGEEVKKASKEMEKVIVEETKKVVEETRKVHEETKNEREKIDYLKNFFAEIEKRLELKKDMDKK